MPTDDDWDAPPPGLVTAIMVRHGVSRDVALARLGLTPAQSPTARTFRSIPEGGRFLHRQYECEKRRPTVWNGRRRVPDRDYDYDVLWDREHRRANAMLVHPRGPRRYAWIYVHPDTLVEPLDPSVHGA